MKKITAENIEAYILDLFEGNLAVEDAEAVMRFLRENPEWKKKYEEMDMLPSLDPEWNADTDWNTLKKKGHWDRVEKQPEYFLIGKLENSLTPEEEAELNDRLLHDAALARAWSLYSRLKLTSNEKEKSELVLFLRQGDAEINPDNYNTFFLIAAETRDAKMLQQVDAWLKLHPAAQAAWDLSQQLNLVPSLHDAMPGKEKLKKHERDNVVLLRWVYSAAAAAAVILLVWWIPFGNSSYVPEMAAENSTQRPTNTLPEQQEHDATDKLPLANTHTNNPAVNHAPSFKDKKNIIPGKKLRVVIETPVPDKKLAGNLELPLRDSIKPRHVEPYEFVTQKTFYNDTVPDRVNSTPAAADVNFTAMKYAVSRVSSGFVEIDRQQSDEARKFSLKVGNWKFSRKKNVRDE